MHAVLVGCVCFVRVLCAWCVAHMSGVQRVCNGCGMGVQWACRHRVHAVLVVSVCLMCEWCVVCATRVTCAMGVQWVCNGRAG